MLTISLDELSQTVVSLLAHSLPPATADRASLLRELRKHRIVKFKDSDTLASMDTILNVLRPVMSYVSDEALQDALALADGAKATRAARVTKGEAGEPATAAPDTVDGAPGEPATADTPDTTAGTDGFRVTAARSRGGGSRTQAARNSAVKISKLITVQWGTLENREWAFGDTVLLTGESGSGKSTLLDAVQSIMTAARQGLYQFNAGQDESTQSRRGGKEPRTLAAYALGQLADNVFLRPRSMSYVAALFDASEGSDEQATPFTAVIGIEANAEQGKAHLQRTIFFVVKRALSLSHFIEGPASERVGWSDSDEGGVRPPPGQAEGWAGDSPEVRGQVRLSAASLRRAHGEVVRARAGRFPRGQGLVQGYGLQGTRQRQ